MTHIILPPATIGIIGGGQLGRMMALAAKPMGYTVIVLDPTPQSPAGQVADDQIIASYDDVSALKNLASRSDVLTYEFENVDRNVLEKYAAKILPQGVDLLRITSDRIAEKTFIRDEAGVPVAPFQIIDSAEQLKTGTTPSILKTVSGGYDGHGQWQLNTPFEASQLADNFPGGRLILETLVNFKQEVSIMVARSNDGQITTWPIAENVHHNHILKYTTVPAKISSTLSKKIIEIAHKIAEKINLRGILGIELFVNDEEVWVNELAPRPHNSGHFTIEAANVSQFEGHIRSVVGLPLPEITLTQSATMLNLLGDELTQAKADFKNHPEWHFHDYGKATIKSDRKMGHITVLGDKNGQALIAWGKQHEQRNRL